jgi:hypothetical protein
MTLRTLPLCATVTRDRFHLAAGSGFATASATGDGPDRGWRGDRFATKAVVTAHRGGRSRSPKSSRAIRGDRGAPSWCTAVTPPQTRRGGGDVYGPGVADLRRDPSPHGGTCRRAVPDHQRPLAGRVSHIGCSHIFSLTGAIHRHRLSLKLPRRRRLGVDSRAFPNWRGSVSISRRSSCGLSRSGTGRCPFASGRLSPRRSTSRRHAGRALHDVLGLEPQPVHFVNSLGLGKEPSIEPVRRRLARSPGVRFKLDAEATWPPELAEEVAATGAVDTIDFKGQYVKPSRIGSLRELFEVYARCAREGRPMYGGGMGELGVGRGQIELLAGRFAGRMQAGSPRADGRAGGPARVRASPDRPRGGGARDRRGGIRDRPRWRDARDGCRRGCRLAAHDGPGLAQRQPSISPLSSVRLFCSLAGSRRRSHRQRVNPVRPARTSASTLRESPRRRS